MAEEKKKSEGLLEGWNFDFVEGAVVLIFLLAILGSFGIIAENLFNSSKELTFYGYKLSKIIDFFRSHLQLFKFLGFALAGISAIGTIVFNRKHDLIWRQEKAKVYPEKMQTISSTDESISDPQKERWQKILSLASSQNPSDWRLAIIEADIMLDELLISMRLPGETMGEKLQAVEKSDFTTLDLAWEAHKARNAIAHEGSNFLLNERETRRLISLYESVFREFELI